MTATGVSPNPFVSFNFFIELDGFAKGGFRECDGLDATTEVIEYREGGDNTTVRKLPGRTSYTDITLRSGMTDSLELWDWRRSVIAGVFERRNGSIVVYDLANSTEVARYNFVRAWPSGYEGPTFDATGNDIAVESLVLAHEGLERV
jgi:phage tail-like protein